MSVEIPFDWDGILRRSSPETKLSAEEVILMLLNAGQVNGKTILQKQVFVAWMEMLKDRTQDFLFHPDQYGPFSSLVGDAVKRLRKEGKIKILPKGEKHETYVITPHGVEHLLQVTTFKVLPKSLLDELAKRKARWDEWDTEGIQSYVYRNYPQYAMKTRIPRLKW